MIVVRILLYRRELPVTDLIEPIRDLYRSTGSRDGRSEHRYKYLPFQKTRNHGDEKPEYGSRIAIRSVCFRTLAGYKIPDNAVRFSSQTKVFKDYRNTVLRTVQMAFVTFPDVDDTDCTFLTIVQRSIAYKFLYFRKTCLT